jgi:hypothetical protein
MTASAFIHMAIFPKHMVGVPLMTRKYCGHM